MGKSPYIGVGNTIVPPNLAGLASQAPGEPGAVGKCCTLAYTPWHLAPACLGAPSTLAPDLKAPPLRAAFLMFLQPLRLAAARALALDSLGLQ